MRSTRTARSSMAAFSQNPRIDELLEGWTGAAVLPNGHAIS